MEDITDISFRKLCKKEGADVVYTEFISSEGLIRDAEKSLKKLTLDESERPIGIQIFGHEVNAMIRATEMATQANPDFIDINFGCPVKKVVSKGAGSGMLRNVPLMMEITREVVKATHLPVTVKTRLGWDEDSKIITDIAEELQDTGIAALTIHGRTRSQMYRGEADWTLIGEVKNNPRIHIPIIGNGDIDSEEKAQLLFDRYGVDGIMIGRASIGNPWIFSQVKHYLKHNEKLALPGIAERCDMCMEHLKGAVAFKGERRGIPELRKHYSGYFKGIFNFKPFRQQLMEAKTQEAVIQIIQAIKAHYAA